MSERTALVCMFLVGAVFGWLLQRFSARLSDPTPFSEAEIARAHFVLSQGRAERQATLPLTGEAA